MFESIVCAIIKQKLCTKYMIEIIKIGKKNYNITFEFCTNVIKYLKLNYTAKRMAYICKKCV